MPLWKVDDTGAYDWSPTSELVGVVGVPPERFRRFTGWGRNLEFLFLLLLVICNHSRNSDIIRNSRFWSYQNGLKGLKKIDRFGMKLF